MVSKTAKTLPPTFTEIFVGDFFVGDLSAVGILEAISEPQVTHLEQKDL